MGFWRDEAMPANLKQPVANATLFYRYCFVILFRKRLPRSPFACLKEEIGSSALVSLWRRSRLLGMCGQTKLIGGNVRVHARAKDWCRRRLLFSPCQWPINPKRFPSFRVPASISRQKLGLLEKRMAPFQFFFTFSTSVPNLGVPLTPVGSTPFRG